MCLLVIFMLHPELQYEFEEKSSVSSQTQAHHHHHHPSHKPQALLSKPLLCFECIKYKQLLTIFVSLHCVHKHDCICSITGNHKSSSTFVQFFNKIHLIKTCNFTVLALKICKRKQQLQSPKCTNEMLNNIWGYMASLRQQVHFILFNLYVFWPSLWNYMFSQFA